MSNATFDRLGDRLHVQISPEDLTLLDAYRREFRPSYDIVVDRLRAELGIETSGRPAKSTAAIVEKLGRSSMRLTQMQDIAGCRVVVADVVSQDALVGKLQQIFDVTIVDRRAQPSHGYRAIHLNVAVNARSVEIQVRTELQHAWAELSEKLADVYGMPVKYGGGPPSVRSALNEYANIISAFESSSDLNASTHEIALNLRQKIHTAAAVLLSQLGNVNDLPDSIR